MKFSAAAIYNSFRKSSKLLKLIFSVSILLALAIISIACFIISNLSHSPAHLEKIELPVDSDGNYFNHPVYGYRPLPFYALYLFFVNHNPTYNPIALTDFIIIYNKECQAENINLAVAFAQMCHETGFLKFGGSVGPEQNNFAGIGAVSSTSPGASFSDRTTGIRVQIQHLKAYASKEALNNDLVDPRFHYVTRNSAKGIFDLAGKWAADKNYGKKLLGFIMEIYSYINAEYSLN
jgi:hypothetical protein